MTARLLVLRCADALPLLHASADGELHPADQRDLELHVATCAACRAARDDLGMLKQRLVALPPTALPEGLMDRIAAEVAVVAATEPPPRSPRGRAVATAVCVVAVALLGLGVLALAHRLPPAEPALAAIFARHTRELPADVVSARPAEIERFLRTRLHPGVRVPALSSAGFALQGARLIDIGERAAAQVSYRGAGPSARRVTLVVVPDASGDLADRLDVAASPTRARGAVHGALWSADTAVYALLTDDDPATVQRLASLSATP